MRHLFHAWGKMWTRRRRNSSAESLARRNSFRCATPRMARASRRVVCGCPPDQTSHQCDQDPTGLPVRITELRAAGWSVACGYLRRGSEDGPSRTDDVVTAAPTTPTIGASSEHHHDSHLTEGCGYQRLEGRIEFRGNAGIATSHAHVTERPGAAAAVPSHAARMRQARAHPLRQEGGLARCGLRCLPARRLGVRQPRLLA